MGTNAKKVWVKRFEDNKWDYELLTDEVEIPEAIHLKIQDDTDNGAGAPASARAHPQRHSRFGYKT